MNIYMFMYYIPTGTWPTGYKISKQVWHLKVELLKKQCSYYMALGTQLAFSDSNCKAPKCVPAFVLNGTETAPTFRVRTEAACTPPVILV
jgi:hypothetical protein